jgi:tight adherence protein C
METQSLVLILLFVLAAISIFAFVIPYFDRKKKIEIYRQVVQNKRQALFEQTKESLNKKISSDQINLSARESLTLFFKVQKKFGAMGEKIRDQMLQAGVRDPKAPMYYLMARIIVPSVLIAFVLLIMTQGQKEFTGVQILMGVGAMGLAGFFLPSLLLKNYIQKRQQEISLTFPDALDMMLICVQGGIGLEQTINRVAEEVAEHSPTLAEELGILSAEMGMLNDRRAALQDFARRVGSASARSFTTAMIQAEQYGTSISGAMRVIADELRDMRMSEAERKAASLPPKLTVPMILFFLPSLFIVILTPAFLAAGEAGLGQ